MFIEKCNSCGLSSTNTISAFGKNWHSSCFFCCNCKKFLTAAFALEIDDKIYCHKCAPEEPSQDLAISENEILGKLTPVDETRWNICMKKHKNKKERNENENDEENNSHFFFYFIFFKKKKYLLIFNLENIGLEDTLLVT